MATGDTVGTGVSLPYKDFLGCLMEPTDKADIIESRKERCRESKLLERVFELLHQALLSVLESHFWTFQLHGSIHSLYI